MHRSFDRRHVVTGDDFGFVKLFNYPCVVDHAPARIHSGHSSHVTNVRWLSGRDDDDEHVVSTGARDSSVMQWDLVRADRRPKEFDPLHPSNQKPKWEGAGDWRPTKGQHKRF